MAKRAYLVLLRGSEEVYGDVVAEATQDSPVLREEQDNSKSGGIFGWIATGLICLILVYPLSTGPAIKLSQAGLLPGWYLKVYQPIFSMVSHNKSAQEVFVWYLEAWHAK